MSTTTEFLTASNDTLATQSSGYAPTTNTSKLSKCFVDDLVIVKVARFLLYSVILLTSLVANSMTVFLIWKKKRMRKTVNYFIVNMAVSDLLITTVYMPRQMIKFFIGPQWNVGGDFGAVLCKVVPSLHVIAVLASILTLVAISMDRFFVVVFPMKTVFSERRVKMTVSLIWLLSIAARVPYFYALEIKGQSCTVHFDTVFGVGARNIYSMSLLIGFCIIPLVAVTTLYSITIASLKLHKSPGNETTARPADRIRQRATKKILKMACSITVVFILCWTPYFAAQIAYNRVPCEFRFWRIFLAHSNTALNPLLYAVFNQEFRQGYKHILCFMHNFAHPVRTSTRDTRERSIQRAQEQELTLEMEVSERVTVV